jgi:hypothetical protein
MKRKDWSTFTLSCSGIDSIFTRPKGVTPLTAKQAERFAKLTAKEEKTEKELASIAHFERKIATWNDPPLSKTAIIYLTERYAWEKYAKKTAAVGTGLSFLEKGYSVETDAVKMLAKIDKADYQKNEELYSNEYLCGKCDIVANRLIEIKSSWNINTFMKVRNYPLSSKYYFQAQGYMELHDQNECEVVFLLLNTPDDLVARERVKLINRFISGEIDRETYEKNCENLAGALSYNNIPMKRRVIRFKVDRDKTIFPLLYEKVIKCRKWLTDFDAVHESGKRIVSLREDYAYKENYPEPDTADPCESDPG